MHKVMMARRKDWQGHYILNDAGVCIAKTCSICRKELPSSSFSPSSSDKMGLKSCCKTCHSRSETSRRAAINAKNPKKIPVDWEYRLNRTQEQIESDQATIHPTGSKECAHCGKDLPLSMFGRGIRYRDGLEFACKECMRIKSKNEDPTINKISTSKYKTKNKLRTKEQVLKDRERLHPDGKKVCSRCRLPKPLSCYYDSLHTKSGLAGECKVCHNEGAVRRARKRDKKYWASVGVPLSCYICGDPWVDGFHSDHVIPKRLGGSDSYPNRLPLCPTHNNSKWMTPLEIWLRETMPERMDEILDRVAGYGVDYRVPDGVYVGVKVFTDGDGLLQWERIDNGQ